MSQGVIYYVTFENQAFTTANGDYDFFELTPVDEGAFEVVGFELVCFELGDAQEEFLRVAWFSDNATSGNGTSATPRPQNPFVSHSQVFTAETVASTPASTGTAISLPIHSIPARGGRDFWYPDGCGPRISQSDTMLCLRMLSTLADDAVFSGTVYAMMS